MEDFRIKEKTLDRIGAHFRESFHLHVYAGRLERGVNSLGTSTGPFRNAVTLVDQRP